MTASKTCDECGTVGVVEELGWFHLEREPNLDAWQSMWDFCSDTCLASWAAARKTGVA